jgi:ribA/ribD-fused uncharacterized protein
MKKVIRAFEGKYRFLSNFWPCKVKYQGIVYPSVEHGFQACKSLSRRDRKRISQLKTAAEAKQAGQKINLRSDWEIYKEIIMYNLLVQKFKDSALKKALLDTGNAVLIEGNWWGDIYWGVCKGKGKNRLGKLLMRLRNNLK